jgi:hypothetical protein
MAKSKVVEDALTSLRALDWQALPPPAQRELFAGLTSVLLEMMEADTTPSYKYRFRAAHARRTGENEDKVALMRGATQSLRSETMDAMQLREVLDLARATAEVLAEVLNERWRAAGAE